MADAERSAGSIWTKMKAKSAGTARRACFGRFSGCGRIYLPARA